MTHPLAKPLARTVSAVALVAALGAGGLAALVGPGLALALFPGIAGCAWQDACPSGTVAGRVTTRYTRRPRPYHGATGGFTLHCIDREGFATTAARGSVERWLWPRAFAAVSVPLLVALGGVAYGVRRLARGRS